MTRNVDPVEAVPEPNKSNNVMFYQCTECGFIYNSDTDLACHMSINQETLNASKEQDKEVTVELTPETQLDNNISPIQEVQPRQDEVKELGPTTGQEDKNKEQTEKEEFLDKEKEKLYTEAVNWRKTAQDIDLDLKQALKSNEKHVKDRLGMEEDYQKVPSAAGGLQQKVHVLEEELKEMKVKVKLDNDEKEKALIAYEELQSALDQEGIPKCPICSRRFPNVDVLTGHIDINNPNNDTENMKDSNQPGYGVTEQYQLVAVKCTKCN